MTNRHRQPCQGSRAVGLCSMNPRGRTQTENESGRVGWTQGPRRMRTSSPARRLAPACGFHAGACPHHTARSVQCRRLRADAPTADERPLVSLVGTTQSGPAGDISDAL